MTDYLRVLWLAHDSTGSLSYRVYLRDTNKINEKHVQALKASATKTMELVQLINDNGDNHYSVCGEYEDGE